MKRFVSYLYSIYNNQKINNSGFARIELRTGRNRIQIHLQDIAHAGKSGIVYLFVRKQENIQGIPIGTITFRNDQADFRYEQPEENIGQTPWQIIQMNGILITIDDRVAFLSQWDEKPVDTERFEVWDKEKEADVSSEQEDQAVTDEQKEQEIVGEPASRSAQDNARGETEKTEENIIPENEKRTENIKNVMTDTQTNEAIMDSGTDIQKNSDRPAEQTSSIRTAEIQPSIPRKLDWEQTWRYMLRVYPVLDQFDDENNVLCVRIEIKDVRLLPDKYWSIVNNSFLLHGFFNYRYLVFGRINDNWFIGIPGVYQNQEHAMASIFGFPDFLPQSEKNERGEQPGYWYRILGL